MYAAFVEQQIRRNFGALSAGDFEPALAGVAEDVTHRFEGEHAIGGTRHSRAGMRRWFERLRYLFPRLTFEVQEVLVRGWPWDTRVAVQWRVQVEPRAGPGYENRGVHLLRIRWGKVVSIHAYEDTHRVSEACRHMAAHGIAEAAAPPIES